MEIYVLAHNKMTQTGESLLKLIQNTSLSTVDLLVRESIQNSLDAAKEDSRSVTVDIITGSCDKKELDKVFTGIEDALGKKIHGSEASYIAVRDSGTVGLTGPIRESEVSHEKAFGNLRKLIYEICQAQPEEGKGGSWGLGKTVYFRVGIGIVLYYSRIKKEDGSYASRMAAALIEDNSKEDSLLRLAGRKKGKFYCGVAWWGANDGADDTIPITDEDEIEKILEIFEIPPYEDEETGTTVIIPYIDEKKLQDNANTQEFSVFSTHTLEEMINLSVQRWYTPRLYNSRYKYGAFLDYRINGSKLRGQEREKFFTILQELYNDAEEKGGKIALRSTFRDDTCAGYLYWQILSRKELNMLPPNNSPSPVDFLLKTINDDMDTSNPPILAYCRKAGMIINYELRGEWVSGVQPTKEDEFLIAFFVLNSDNIMREDKDLTLDEYIRKGEKADHMSWQDHEVNNHKYQVVRKLKHNISRKIKEAVAPNNSASEKHSDTALQKMMGACFLPTQNFGHLSTPKPSYKGGIASGKNTIKRVPGINDVKVTFISENELELRWSVLLKKKQKKIVHELMAMASVPTHATDWEDDKHGVGGPFPFSIIEADATYKGENLDCTLIKSQKGIPCEFIIDSSGVTIERKEKTEIDCHIIVGCADPSLTCSLSVKEAAQ